jgi:hypothetical protein
MIYCKVCSNLNDDLSIHCVSCGSYLQDRVPNLDFFKTLWMMIESPRTAFKRITLSEQKNYVLTIMLIFGIAISFSLLWSVKVGNNFDNLIYLILLGLVTGFCIGIPICFSISSLLYIAFHIIGGKGSYKNTYAVFSWSLTPIIISAVILLPIDFATLGLLLFSTNPSASEVKPIVYFILIGLNILAFLWSMILGSYGLSMIHKIKFMFSLLLMALIIPAVTWCLYLLTGNLLQ